MYILKLFICFRSCVNNFFRILWVRGGFWECSVDVSRLYNFDTELCLPVPYITRYSFSMYHPSALSHPLCISDILSSLLASLVINDIKKSCSYDPFKVISPFFSNTWQMIRPCSLMPNIWLSQSPLLHAFSAPNFSSLNVILGTTLYLSLHYFDIIFTFTF